MKLCSLLLALLLLCARARAGPGAAVNATAYYHGSDESVEVRFGVLDAGGCARAIFNDSIDAVGWATFHVESGAGYADGVAMYCVGFLEGALMQTRMWQHANNLISSFLQQSAANVTFPADLTAWLAEQDAWARAQAAARMSRDPFWDMLNSTLRQLDGSIAGYRSVAPASEALPALAFQIGVGNGDLLDLLSAFDVSTRTRSAEDEAFYARLRGADWRTRPTHCSALFKASADLSDVWAAHTSWFLYQNGGLRVAKYYDLHLRNPEMRNHRTSLSSYPLFLSVSLDDWYVTEPGLVVTETSNSVIDTSLYRIVVDDPHVLLSWQRSTLANRLSATCEEWVTHYARHPSGTYNNQWVCFNTHRLEPRKALHDGALWIVEQAPGMLRAHDVTSYLRLGYWPSYNVPFDPEVYRYMGYDTGCKDDPEMACYSTCVRANIFRERQARVKSVHDMQWLIRYNEWKTDPLSEGDPGYAISSRFDLEALNPGAFGGYDGKVTDVAQAKRGAWWGQMGPTHDSPECPPFAWTGQWASLVHMGVPEVLNFNWTYFEPRVWD